MPPVPRAVEWRARRWVRRYADARAGVNAYYDLYEVPLHLLHRFDLGQKGDPFQPGGLARETVFDAMRNGVRYRLVLPERPGGQLCGGGRHSPTMSTCCS
jgi:hypothetical protein